MIIVSITKQGKLIEKLECDIIVPRAQNQGENDSDYQLYLANCNALEVSRVNALKQNSINRGYSEDEIEIKKVTDAEWEEIWGANKPVIPIEERKRQAYKTEADPLYLEWQALLAAAHADADAKRLEWLAKRAEIQARFT